MARTSVIAEAGVNHNGDIGLAMELVDAAAAAGADIIKFQTFSAAKLASTKAEMASYQKQNTGADERQVDMLARLELSRDAHYLLKQRCAEKGIEFLSSPFDIESMRFLSQDLGLTTLKIPSGEITNGPYLLKAGNLGCRLIVSTGMSTLEDVQEALSVIAFGLLKRSEPPSRTTFRDAFESAEGQAALTEKAVLLHCTSAYPTPFAATNLRAMETLKAAFGLPVGFSDHTQGTLAPVVAVSLGATVVEKHFTLDRGLPGPDHRASLEPDELTAMVGQIRDVESILGSADKQPVQIELNTREVARKSLVAKQPIYAGQVFSEENVDVKRPGTGISPMEYWSYIGKASGRDIEPDELI